MSAAGSQIDALLLPYIHAKHEADSERLLTSLVSEYVEPVIRQVIRSKLRVRFDRRGRASNNPDAEDLIWRAPAGGGAPERLTDRHTQRPAVSPDGGLLAYVYMDEKEWGLAVLALDQRKVIKKFPFPSNVGSRAFRWTPDGALLAYIINEKGASNIWLQPLNGERPRQLTNFKSGKLLSFAWSPDGQWLAYMRNRATSNVVLLRDLK